MAAIMELKRRFAVRRTNFNDNISTSEVMAAIQAIDGVNAIETFKIVNNPNKDIMFGFKSLYCSIFRVIIILTN